jgi:hypothetical protein
VSALLLELVTVHHNSILDVVSVANKKHVCSFLIRGKQDCNEINAE